MTKWYLKKRTIAAIVIAAGVVGALTATAVAQSQRFPDVPPDHSAYEAVEWAAEVGLTLGYPDGTFKPEAPLGKWHAVVFMERYYDQILQASESPDFTRGDMMELLKAINDASPAGPSAWTVYDDGIWTIAETSNEAGFFVQGRCAATGIWRIYLGHKDSGFSFVEPDPGNIFADSLSVGWQFGSKARRFLFTASISRPLVDGQPTTASNLVWVSGDVLDSDLSARERFLLDAQQDTSGTLDISTHGDREYEFSLDVTGSEFIDTLQVCVDMQA